MHAALLCALLTSSPAQISDVKLAGSVFVMDLRNGGVGADEARTLTTLITTYLGKQTDRKVISANEVRELIDLEADRSMAECSQEGCLAELAGALDAEFVIFGDVTKVGSYLILNLALADKQGQVLRRESVDKARDLDGLLVRYKETVDALIATLEGDLVVEAPPAPEVEPPSVQQKRAVGQMVGWSTFGVASGLTALTLVGVGVAAPFVHPAVNSGDASSRQNVQTGLHFLTGTAIFFGAVAAGGLTWALVQ